jgi:hypothetical protein
MISHSLTDRPVTSLELTSLNVPRYNVCPLELLITFDYLH